MAILLIKKIGLPAPSIAYGIREPNGYPDTLRDAVERVAIVHSETSVRTRSA
jgi:hypothetical protein